MSKAIVLTKTYLTIVMECSVNVDGCFVSQARYNHALDLLRLERHREAVPYLALAIAGQPDLRPARTLLAQVCFLLPFLAKCSDFQFSALIRAQKSISGEVLLKKHSRSKDRMH